MGDAATSAMDEMHVAGTADSSFCWCFSLVLAQSSGKLLRRSMAKGEFWEDDLEKLRGSKHVFRSQSLISNRHYLSHPLRNALAQHSTLQFLRCRWISKQGPCGGHPSIHIVCIYARSLARSDEAQQPFPARGVCEGLEEGHGQGD
jgi:hypothetical protein